MKDTKPKAAPKPAKPTERKLEPGERLIAPGSVIGGIKFPRCVITRSEIKEYGPDGEVDENTAEQHLRALGILR